MTTAAGTILDLGAAAPWRGRSATPGGDANASVTAYWNAPAAIMQRFFAAVPTIATVTPASSSGTVCAKMDGSIRKICGPSKKYVE